MLTINGKRVYSAINIYAWDETYEEIIADTDTEILEKYAILY